jgi:hypothetical protein
MPHQMNSHRWHGISSSVSSATAAVLTSLDVAFEGEDGLHCWWLCHVHAWCLPCFPRPFALWLTGSPLPCPGHRRAAAAGRAVGAAGERAREDRAAAARAGRHAGACLVLFRQLSSQRLPSRQVSCSITWRLRAGCLQCLATYKDFNLSMLLRQLVEIICSIHKQILIFGGRD